MQKKKFYLSYLIWVVSGSWFFVCLFCGVGHTLWCSKDSPILVRGLVLGDVWKMRQNLEWNLRIQLAKHVLPSLCFSFPSFPFFFPLPPSPSFFFPVPFLFSLFLSSLSFLLSLKKQACTYSACNSPPRYSSDSFQWSHAETITDSRESNIRHRALRKIHLIVENYWLDDISECVKGNVDYLIIFHSVESQPEIKEGESIPRAQ